MGFENATNMIRAKDYNENEAIRSIKKEEGKKSLEEKIQNAVDKIPNILKSATNVAIAENLMTEQNLSSNALRKMAEEDNERLEKLCDPCDPVTIIALVQYYEVNKKELN